MHDEQDMVSLVDKCTSCFITKKRSTVFSRYFRGGSNHISWKMIRKKDLPREVIGLKETVGKAILVVGTTSTAWGRFGGSRVYHGKGSLLRC